MGPNHGIRGQIDRKEVKVEHLFLLMGSTLKLLDSAPAGAIVGIGGLDEVLVKTGTISTSQACPNFVKAQTLSMGLVKVAVQSKSF